MNEINSIRVPNVLALHARRTEAWHHAAYAPSEQELLGLIEEEHHCNFELWHEEDKARRDDQGHEYVYRAKRSIDAWNQRRNDGIERIDRWLIERLSAFADGTPMNSETPGMIIDRLSIMALKEYHMAEEADREDAPAEHRARCVDKLAIIRRQRADLGHALEELLDAVVLGTRGFRVYYQFKMYNDPALNPELYRNRAGT